MLIRVLQGEREMARDNWELGQFEIPFAAGPRGSARVGVQFQIDADGILQVLARDTHTQQDTLLEIQSSAVCVEDSRVEQMISASVDFAFEDMNERQWTEASIKARELLQAVQQALAEASDLISPEQTTQIRAAETAVSAALEHKNLPQLKAANRALDEATEALAAAIVEKALEESLMRRGIL
jgi:molecular chaperone DnaK